MAANEGLKGQLEGVSRRLERMISSTIEAGVPEPPRLVRANSAFDLLKAAEKLLQNPEFADLARD